MAIEVEDGTGKPNAESYLSVASALEYCARVGLTAFPAASLPQQEAALRRATQFLDASFRYRGERLRFEQLLEFPRAETVRRQYASRVTGWPQPKLEAACAEMADAAIAGPLITTLDANGVKREKVGPIETEYFAPVNSGQRIFALVEGLLKDLTIGYGNVITVERG